MSGRSRTPVGRPGTRRGRLHRRGPRRGTSAPALAEDAEIQDRTNECRSANRHADPDVQREAMVANCLRQRAAQTVPSSASRACSEEEQTASNATRRSATDPVAADMAADYRNRNPHAQATLRSAFGGRARAGGGHRRWRRRDVDRVPPDRARLEGRRPRRSRGAHVRLDVPLGGPRGPAPIEHDPDPDDDVRRRAVPAPDRRDRRRRVVARGRLAAAGIDEGALRGAAAPGGLGEDLRAAARAHLRRGGAGEVPAR